MTTLKVVEVLDQLLDRSGRWSTGDGGHSGPKPELPDLEEVLEHLKDQSGMWSTGDGGGSGPKPELTEPELDDNENLKVQKN